MCRKEKRDLRAIILRERVKRVVLFLMIEDDRLIPGYVWPLRRVACLKNLPRPKPFGTVVGLDERAHQIRVNDNQWLVVSL